jgi:hypothetical protein
MPRASIVARLTIAELQTPASTSPSGTGKSLATEVEMCPRPSQCMCCIQKRVKCFVVTKTYRESCGWLVLQRRVSMRLRPDFKDLLQPWDGCMIGERHLSLCFGATDIESFSHKAFVEYLSEH